MASTQILFLIISASISLVIGAMGQSRKIGFRYAFLFSFFLSPVIGLIIVLCSKKINLETIDLINAADRDFKNKRYDAAIEKLIAANEIDPMDKDTCYNLACLLSLTNDEESAMAFLQQAISLGYINFNKIKSDKDLEWLRKQKSFVEFIEPLIIDNSVPSNNSEKSLWSFLNILIRRSPHHKLLRPMKDLPLGYYRLFLTGWLFVPLFMSFLAYFFTCVIDSYSRDRAWDNAIGWFGFMLIVYYPLIRLILWVRDGFLKSNEPR